MRISFPHRHLCPENGYEGWAAIWKTQKFISSEKLNKSKRFPCCVRKSIFCRLAANKSATSHDSRVTCGCRGKFLRLKSTSTLEACGGVHKYHDNNVNIWLLKIVWVFKTMYVHCHEQFFSRKCQICSIGCGPTRVWCHNNVSQSDITGMMPLPRRCHKMSRFSHEQARPRNADGRSGWKWCQKPIRGREG